MATLIKADGNVSEVKPKDGTTFSQHELDDLVTPGEHLYLQALQLDGGRWMWLHEEGKFRGLPVNETATALMAPSLHPTDKIVGDVLITEPGEVL